MSGDEDDDKRTTVEPAPPAPGNVVRVDFKRSQRTQPSDPLAPQKFAVFSRFIGKGKTMVTLDARRPGVSVPPHLAGELQLNLDFSVRFGLADFAYDERGVRASLSFKGQPFFCDVPWSAVYALFSHAENGERLTWPGGLPKEILEQLPERSIEELDKVLEEQLERLMRSAREQNAPAGAPRIAVVQDDAGDAPAKPGDGDGDADGPPSPPGGGGGGLRLVKS